MIMKELIIKALELTKFSNQYTKLCNEFNKVDDGATFKKDDLLKILNNLDCSFRYSAREKLFYQNYSINGNSIRFVLPFKYGFIDCSYTIWNELKKFRIGGSFADFSVMVDENFESNIEYKFPIATSHEDLAEILNAIIQTHNDFIKEFEQLST